MPIAAAFTPRDPQFKDAVTRHFAAQDYLRLLGVELAAVEPGQVTFRVPFRADLGQQDGFFHGGLIGGVAEAVMGSAAFSLVEAGANVLGASYTLNLLNPGRGPALMAVGQVVKAGRTLVVCRADVYGGEEPLTSPPCAIAQGAMAVVAPRG